MTTTAAKGPLTKKELVSRVAELLIRNKVVKQKWQAEKAVEATIDLLCDAIAERRGVKFLHRFAITLVKKAERTIKVPRPDDGPNGLGHVMKEVVVPAHWEAKLALGGWVKRQLQRGKAPAFWARHGIAW